MRCNIGINPNYLTDQWLIAEYCELPMIVGSFRANEWKIKSPVMDTFNFGKGHLNWFKVRLEYLHIRHEEVKKEMSNRGFKCDSLTIEKSKCPNTYWNNWKPSIEDSMKLRHHLVGKITNRKLPLDWWRYKRVKFNEDMLKGYLDTLVNGEMYFV